MISSRPIGWLVSRQSLVGHFLSLVLLNPKVDFSVESSFCTPGLFCRLQTGPTCPAQQSGTTRLNAWHINAPNGELSRRDLRAVAEPNIGKNHSVFFLKSRDSAPKGEAGGPGKLEFMKILLIYPYPLFDRSKAYEEDISTAPIGMYYVAAVLKEKGYDVEVFNWFDIHRTPEKIAATIREKRPNIIGFTIFNANRWGGIEIAGIAKQIDRNIKIVFGGVAATFLWEHFLRHFPEVDFVVLGEGEYTFLNLVQLIEKADYKHLAGIDGIAFRKGGKITKTQPARLINNLDELPIPAKYFTYQHVVSSRGCPGKCTFCGSPRFWKHRVRFRSAENFVRELEILNTKGVAFFYVSDDTFTAKPERVIDICKKILEKGLVISWFAISRVDHVNEDMLCWMRKAGCIQISYGVESGSEKIRKLLGKPLKTKHIKKAFALTYTYGLLARAYFIYGSPGETEETIEETIDLIKEIKPFICIPYILEIYPGTGLYHDYQRKCHFTDDIWLKRIEGICYFELDPTMTEKRVAAFGQKIRQAVYDNLPLFVSSLTLIDNKEFFKRHADFCSRLGLTFSHGDYAMVPAIKNKKQTAAKLFKMALDYAPDHRAYLGLGLLMQQTGDFIRAEKLLEEGIRHFPYSEELNLCLGVTLMNLGKFKDALQCLRKFEGSPRARHCMAQCFDALGNQKKKADFMDAVDRHP